MLCLLLGVLCFAQDESKKKPPSQKEASKVFQPLTDELRKAIESRRDAFLIKEATSEPELPPTAKAEEKGIVPLPGGGYACAIVENGKETHRLVLPAQVLVNSGFVEVFGTFGPKDHESVLQIDSDVFPVDIALSGIVGLERGGYPQKYGEADKYDASRVLVFVQWKDEHSKVRTYRAEDLLIDIKRMRLFPRIGWVYLGTWLESENPVTKQKTRLLSAGLSRLFMTTFRDPYSLIDNPLREADATDDNFVANMFLLPKAGQNVSVILRRPTDEEMKSIKQIEKEFYQ